MAPSAPKLKVFFIPFYATGHMLPFLDLAFLFSTRPNIEPTLLITAANAPLLQPTIDIYGGRIKLLLFPFPSAESGLLPGQENVSSIPYADIYKMCTAADLSRDPIESLLCLHCPDAIVSDISFSWMSSLASELGIPNVVFHVIGVFPQRVMDALHQARLYDTEDTSDEVVTIPDLPGEKQITMPRSELPWFVRKRTQLTHHWARMKAANVESFGVVVNTFCEMEPEFCEEYRRTVCQKAWFVGPVALAAARTGGKKAAAADDGSQCLRWLDGQRDGSVVYVCFGSWCNFTEQQLAEIAGGLEKSGKEFLWVVRGLKDGEITGEEWIPNGWEKRVEGRGLMVRGWAPQTAILAHKAIGGFMTQCGWNAVLESVATAGVPLLTWPLVFEQYMNERLVVEVLEGGVRVWDGRRSTMDVERVVVPAEVIEKVVFQFMDGEGGAVRARAKELAEMARCAVAEGGGSWNDFNCLIDELMATKELKMKKERENANYIRP